MPKVSKARRRSKQLISQDTMKEGKGENRKAGYVHKDTKEYLSGIKGTKEIRTRKKSIEVDFKGLRGDENMKGSWTG